MLPSHERYLPNLGRPNNEKLSGRPSFRPGRSLPAGLREHLKFPTMPPSRFTLATLARAALISAIGPSATSLDVRRLIAIGGKADEAPTGQSDAHDPQQKSGGQSCGDAQRFSLSGLFARSAEFCREIFKLRQAVAHGHNGLGIIDVDTRIESESRKSSCKNIH
jgi:hypothetical protein